MWVLIITIVINNGVSVDSVPGFKSRESCVAAADAWLKEAPSFAARRSVICTQQ